MTYYINPVLFYIIDVSAGLKMLLSVLGILMLVAAFIAVIILCGITLEPLTDLNEDQKKPFKAIKKVVIASVIILFIGTFLPSKETCIEMLVASKVTHENVTATKAEIYEIIDYITDKMKGDKE